MQEDGDDDMVDGDLGDGMRMGASGCARRGIHHSFCLSENLLLRTQLLSGELLGTPGLQTPHTHQATGRRITHLSSISEMSREDLEVKLQEAAEVIDLLYCELDVTHRYLEGKYEALKILQGKAILEKATSHTKSLLQKSEEKAKALEKEVNNLQWELSFLQLQMKKCEQRWEQDHSRMLSENKALTESLEETERELQQLRAQNSALRREYLELVSMLSIRDQVLYQKTKPPHSPEGDAHVLELAVLGACQCLGANGVCPCSRNAAASRKQVALLHQELDAQHSRRDEALMVADAFRIAFEQQLKKRSEHLLLLAETSIYKPQQSRAEAGGGASPLVSVRQKLRALLPSSDVKRPEELLETLYTLMDLLNDKEEALAHQRKVSLMLAHSAEELQKKLQSDETRMEPQQLPQDSENQENQEDSLENKENQEDSLENQENQENQENSLENQENQEDSLENQEDSLENQENQEDSLENQENQEDSLENQEDSLENQENQEDSLENQENQEDSSENQENQENQEDSLENQENQEDSSENQENQEDSLENQENQEDSSENQENQENQEDSLENQENKKDSSENQEDSSENQENQEDSLENQENQEDSSENQEDSLENQENKKDSSENQEDSSENQENQEDSLENQEDSLENQENQEDSLENQENKEDSLENQENQEDSLENQENKKDSSENQENSLENKENQEDSLENQENQEDSLENKENKENQEDSLENKEDSLENQENQEDSLENKENKENQKDSLENKEDSLENQEDSLENQENKKDSPENQENQEDSLENKENQENQEDSLENQEDSLENQENQTCDSVH